MKSVKSNLLVLMLILNATTSLAGNGDVESANRQAKLVGYSCEAIPKTLVQDLFRSGKYASANMNYLDASQNLRVTLLDIDSMSSGDEAAMVLRMTAPSIAPYIGNMSIDDDGSTQMVMRNTSPLLVQNLKDAKHLGKRNGYHEFLLGNQSDLELYENRQLFKILDSAAEDAGTKEQFLKAYSLPKSALPDSTFETPKFATRAMADVSMKKSGNLITYRDDQGRDRTLAIIEPQPFVTAENEYFSVGCHLLNIRQNAVAFDVEAKQHKIVDQDMVPFWGEFFATKGSVKVNTRKNFFDGRENYL